MVQALLDQYQLLLNDLDQKTETVYRQFSEIPCKNKCFDCCKQLFPISFVEAYYLSKGIKTLDRSLRRERTTVASKINKKILEKNPLRFEKCGVDKKTAFAMHNEFARFLHGISSDCPALDPGNKGGACTVYPFRNHDCRTMGASFDTRENAIVGCFRFNTLKYLAPKLLDFSYRYNEKIALDQKMIQEMTGSFFTPNILYYTTMCGPFLKDYETTDWIAFFKQKNIPAENTQNRDAYWVVIDV